jgi:hypothetical protein
MLRYVLVIIALLLSTATETFAKECKAVFEPTATSGLVTRMTLYKFTDHYELQFLTPSQLPLLDMIAEIDGAAQKVFLAGGLDDELFMITDEENGIAVSSKTLDALAKGKELEVKGRGSDGKAESAVFALKDFGAKLKKMPRGCGK